MSTEQSIDKSTLTRNLSVWGALGLSVAFLGPSMASNINPQAPAAHVGRAVPLVFFVATVAILCVAYGFARLSQHFSHAGSVYGFTAATLGPKSGFAAGWLLLGTYVVYTVAATAGCALFISGFLQQTGIWNNVNWVVPYVVAFLAIAFLATRPAKSATSVLLVVEVTTIILILAVAVVVFVKLGSNSAPGGLGLDASVYTLPPGVGFSALAVAMTFGFLSFAGFEGSATLGEETKNPRKAIPVALIGSVILGGGFLFIATSAESMGFGANPKGVEAFISSSSLMGELGTSYVSSWLGNVVTLGAGLSAFASALASTVAASRLLFAISRDGAPASRLGRARKSDGVPVAAVSTVLAAIAFIAVVLRVFFTSKVIDVFFWPATVGTLALLVSYFVFTVGAVRYLFFSQPRRAPMYEIVIPVLGLAIVGYTLYSNVIPIPPAPYNYFPYMVIAWLVVGAVGVAAVPGAAGRIGRGLAQEAGESQETRTT